MSQLLSGLRAAHEKQGSSPQEFGEGGQYRIEIPSVEGPAAFEAVIDAGRERGVPIHRISQGSGITLLTDAEITRYSELGAQHAIEVCLFVGPRSPWNGESASPLVPDGKFFGWRHLSTGTLSAAYDDVVRATELGIRSVLASDEGLIVAIEDGRRRGELPEELIVKASANLGIGNALGARLLVEAGVTTVNVAGDISIRDLAAFRSVLAAPIDLYVEGPDGLGGFTRYHDVGEIVRVAAPVHLKFGLRNAPGIYPSGGHLEAVAIATGRERVRRAEIGLEHLRRQRPEAVMAPVGVRRGGVPVV